MNAQEFKEEVLHSDICPDGFELMYSDFQRFQKMAWGALLAFHDVCENNYISYQLAFGSLLGAVRDGGQIPWDYDIDVFVLAKDRGRLIAALKDNLDIDYYYHCAECNSLCRDELIRICPKGYRPEALHVDVFFLAGAPENEHEFQTYTKKIRFLCKTRFEKLVNIKETYPGKPLTQLMRYIKRLKYFFYDVNKLHTEYLKLSTKYSVYTTSKSVNANAHSGCYYIPSDYIRETKLIEIDGKKLRIPINYDGVLKILFKEYMKVPALSVRINEVIKHYKMLKYYEKVK